jgi:ankyrin repeat protein
LKNISKIKQHLQYGFDVNTELNSSTHTTLLANALEGEHYELCELLIHHGADVNVITCHSALSTKRTHNLLIRLMEFSKTPNTIDIKLFKLLIEHGCDVNFTNTDGLTPLLYVIYYCSYKKHLFETVELLLKNGANVNATTSYGASSVHLAGMYGLLDICQLLLDYGADVMIEDKRGERPSGFSKRYGYEDCYEFEVCYEFLLQKEQERELLSHCFKRAHISDNDDCDDNDLTHQ